MRIVSLLPSSTEIVALVGALDDLVGISHECDYPASVSSKPILTSSKISVDQLSGEIDRDVRATLQNALAVYDVDAKGLEAARPDVVLTQDLCEVCAVSLQDVERALKAIAKTDVALLSLKPVRLDDHGDQHGVFGDVERVGEALGRAEEGRHAADQLRARCQALATRGQAAVAANGGTRPTVLTIEWMDPVMVGGTWMPELVEIAGGQALVTSPGEHAPTLNREQLAALRPDVVLIKPCGFDLARTDREITSLRELIHPMPWPAMESGRVFVADGNAFFNRPGPRLVESAEILAAVTHPAAFAAEATKHAASFRPLG